MERRVGWGFISLYALAFMSTSLLFKKVHAFNQFETGARAFVDLAALVKLAQSRGREMGKLMSDLGLDRALARADRNQKGVRPRRRREQNALSWS